MTGEAVGALLGIERLAGRYRVGMESVHVAVRRDGDGWQQTIAVGPDGRRRAPHVQVDGPIVFIPEEPEARTSFWMAIGIVLIVLGVIAVGAAFGFSASVPEFPPVAKTALLAGGGGLFLLGTGLLFLHRAVTRRRRLELPEDGVYLFDDALIQRQGGRARVFPRRSIVALAVHSTVAGTSGPAGGPGRAVTFYQSQLDYRRDDGVEARHVIDMYRYSIFPDPPMNALLEEWLGAGG